MDLKTTIGIAIFVVSVLTVTCILLQARGSGLGSAFGGDGNVYRTKRGVEKRLFQATIVLAIVFFGLALANTLV